MPNILELRRRHGEITALVTKALDDEEAGRLTTKQFIGTVSPLIDEADDIDVQMKAYNQALRWGGGHALDDTSGDPPEWSGGPGGFPPARGIDNGKRLVFGTKSASGLASQDARRWPAWQQGTEQSASAVVAQEFAPIIALGKPAHSLLDVLPTIPHDSAEFAYMRQTTRTNNAAVVAESALKPTSVYTVTRVESKLEVVAHLSESVPRFWFIDNVALQGFLSNELDYGLRIAVEAKVLADINATSGTQTQAFRHQCACHPA